MNLLDRTVAFAGALRRAGVPVSTAELLDVMRVMGAVDILDRRSLQAGMGATACKRPALRPTFDTLFDLYFPPVRGEATLPDDDIGGDSDGDPAEPADSAELSGKLRDQLFELLLDGDDDAINRLARQAVSGLGRVEGPPGRQNWFSYRVLRALSPETLVSGLLDAFLQGKERGGLAEQVARATITERLRRFQEAVEAEVRRRIAEERGVDDAARKAVKPTVEQVEFLRANRQDLVELRRTVYPLARRLATRLTARRRLGRSGRLDFRRTMRASLATGGVPLETKHRPHKPHKPELVVLCDVSGSVASFAHFTLMLTHALREQFSKVRAFAFIDTCDEVTSYLQGSDVGDAVSRIAAEADLVYFDGHSDYGHSFEVFAERYPDAVNPRTSLLILGDGRNNYRATGAAALRNLTHQARHAYWLNPEPRATWGSGDSAISAYSPLVDEMVECRNAKQLEAFVQRLLPV